MPKFETHISVSTVGSAVLAAWGTARYGWDGSMPVLAFFAGAAGGMVPDLDSDTSRPRGLAGVFAGLAAATGAIGFVTSSGPFLNRPWSMAAAFGFGAWTFFLINLLTLKVLKKYTRHRGLFHSLPVPFIYGGLMACLAVPRGADTAMAVWLLAVFGVMSHLMLDAFKSLSLNPLKLATSNIRASTGLWLITAAVTLAAYARLTRV